MQLPPLDYERQPGQQTRFGIVVTVLIWGVRGVALIFFLTAVGWLVILATDPGAGRAGQWARSLVTPEVRRQEALLNAAVLLVSAVLIWLMSPARLWSWRSRCTTRHCSGPPGREGAR